MDKDGIRVTTIKSSIGFNKKKVKKKKKGQPLVYRKSSLDWSNDAGILSGSAKTSIQPIHEAKVCT